MVQMESHADIVNAIGIDAIANLTGVKPIGVKRWKERNRIPAEYWCSIVEIAKTRKVRGVTLLKLAIWVSM